VLDLVDSNPTFTVSTSSTFHSLPLFAPRNLVDGNAATEWVSGLRDDGFTPDSDPFVMMHWSEPRRLDSIVAKAAPGYAQPRSVRIVAGGEVRTVPLSADGDASFPAVITDQVTVQFVLPPARIFPADTPEVETMRVGLASLEFPALHDLQLGPVDPSNTVDVDCTRGPAVDVAGTQRRFSVKATLDDVIHLRAIDATPCDPTPVTLSTGEQRLDATPATGPFVIAGVRLMDPKVEPSTSPTARTAVVTAWNDEQRDVRVAAGAATYLAINENANDGWTATLSGRPLESVVLDGWRQGYLVPAGEGGVVELRFASTTLYRAGLILGLLLVLLLIAGSLLPERRSDAAPAGEGSWPRWLAIGAPVALAIVFGGLAALVVVGCWALRRRPAQDSAVIIVLMLLAATVGAALPLPFDSTDVWTSFGTGVSALVVLALAGLGATLLPPVAERRS